MKRITDLTAVTAPVAADELILRNSANGETSRITLGALFAMFGGVVQSSFQLLWGVKTNANMVGSRVTFDAPFNDTNYVVLTVAQKNDAAVVVTLGTVAGATKSASYIDLFPAEDSTTIGWVAIGDKVV